jgi:carbohydrate-selective porin OprB
MGDEYRHTADPKGAAAETMFEAYYSIDLGGYLFVTPDIKVVLDPYADRKAPANVVFGVRAVALF